MRHPNNTLQSLNTMLPPREHPAVVKDFVRSLPQFQPLFTHPLDDPNEDDLHDMISISSEGEAGLFEEEYYD